MKVVRKNEENVEVEFFDKKERKKGKKAVSSFWDKITIEHVITFINRRNNNKSIKVSIFVHNIFSPILQKTALEIMI